MKRAEGERLKAVIDSLVRDGDPEPSPGLHALRVLVEALPRTSQADQPAIVLWCYTDRWTLDFQSYDGGDWGFESDSIDDLLRSALAHLQRPEAA